MLPLCHPTPCSITGLGFTGAQIGLLTGITPLITLFSVPLWTGLADMTRRHRLVMSLALLVGVSMMLLFPLLNAFAPVLLAAVLFNAFFAPVSSFADSATMAMLADEKEMYGRIRLGGTIGYGLTAPIAGMLVQKHGLKWAFWGCAALFFLAFIVSQKLVYGQGTFGATVFGLGTAVGGFTGGLLLESVGGRGLYPVFGVVWLATVVIVTLIQRRLPAEQRTSPQVVMH